MSASFTQLFIDAAEAKRVYVSKLSEEERKEDMIADIVLGATVFVILVLLTYSLETQPFYLPGGGCVPPRYGTEKCPNNLSSPEP